MVAEIFAADFHERFAVSACLAPPPFLWPCESGFIHVNDAEAIAQVGQVCQALRRQLAEVVVGQDSVIEQMLIGLFARGHSLLVGVPGLAKTLMVRTLADVLGLQFSRIQFTPDLMPSDILGTEVIQEDKMTGHRELRFLPGPVFANLILADEINRTPPKTQAALLEAMQERQITVGGKKHLLPEPFFVMATQNPIEQEGTYPLPEAQLDRFMLQIWVDYPTAEEELEIVFRTTGESSGAASKTMAAADLHLASELVRRIPIAEPVARYAMTLARSTRPVEPDAPDFVKKYVEWGAGPRASQYLVLAAKARAVIHGKLVATCDDVRQVAMAVLRHRIQVNYTADADGFSASSIVEHLLKHVPEVPAHGASQNLFRTAERQ